MLNVARRRMHRRAGGASCAFPVGATTQRVGVGPGVKPRSAARISPRDTLRRYCPAAMIAIDIRADVDRAVRSLSKLQRTVIPTATARALNKTGAQAKTQAGREIATRYNISSRVAGRQIRVTRASKVSLTAIVRPSGRKLPVMAFQARQTAAGVRVHIKRGSPKVIAHAFIAAHPIGPCWGVC